MAGIPLIPRKILFANPDRESVQISPNGSYLAYLAPLDGVLNVWIAPRDRLDAAQAITHDTGSGIRFYQWAHTNRHILYLQDKNGDENWHLYSVDVATQTARDLTPFEGTQAQIKLISPRHPNSVVIGLNKRNPQWHDLYQVDIISGALTLLEQHDRFADIVIDDDYRPLLAYEMTQTGGTTVFRRSDQGEWEAWDEVPSEDFLTTSPAGVDKAGEVIFLKDSRGRNTSALVAQNLATREITVLAQDDLVDAEAVICHPTDKHVQAVSFVYQRQRWQILDTSIEPDMEYLRTVADGEIELASRTLDDQTWIVRYTVDDGPARFYLYERAGKATRFLFTNRQALESLPLVKMHPVLIQARDGVEMVAYYSLPPGADTDQDGIPDGPVPLVLLPHGGPWGRDFWSYDKWHQWLANRGYAVLSVNFRSSTGFGKAYTNAGDREWGGRIIEDQYDAVQWSIARGIAQSHKVAVMGGSFGGYSTLAGLTFFPDTYACGVDIFGPVNLITLLETIPEYWKSTLELFTTKVGDFRTAEGRTLLTRHSPLTYVERIRSPLLIGQGANDPRVKQAESDQIVKAMESKHIPVTYVLYPDEGHGFARPENWMSFNAIAETFLAKCLGGRCEPIGEDFKGSSLQVLCGAEDVPGLVDSLAASHDSIQTGYPK